MFQRRSQPESRLGMDEVIDRVVWNAIQHIAQRSQRRALARLVGAIDQAQSAASLEIEHSIGKRAEGDQLQSQDLHASTCSDDNRAINNGPIDSTSSRSTAG